MSWVTSTRTKQIIKLINISFKQALHQDLEQILAIELRAYEFPWSKKQFTDSFNNPNTRIQLIVFNQQIAGYLLILQSIEFVDILNICIDPKFQQQGLGARLLDDLLESQQDKDTSAIILEVRKSNISAIYFYKKYGFECIDTRKKYYSNGEDAKILRLQIK